MKSNGFSAQTRGVSNNHLRGRPLRLPLLFMRRPLSLLAHLSSLLLLAFSTLTAVCRAGNFTTSVQETSKQSWDNVIWEPGPVPVSRGNTYEVLNGGFIYAPFVNSIRTYVFPGDSLTLDEGASLCVNSPSNEFLVFPGTDGNPGLILNGGYLEEPLQPSGSTVIIAGRMAVVAPSTIYHFWFDGGFVITAQITGTGDLAVVNGSLSAPLDIQSTNNPYSGAWEVQDGYLLGSGVGSLGTGNITVSPAATLEVDYDIQSPGTLTLLGSDSVMVLHQNCQFGAVFINGVALAPGTYTFNNLFAQYPGNFASGGLGSITVPAVQSTFVPPPVTAPGYYVDYAGGSDANPGTDPTTAWQHCPGDLAATGVAGSTPLNPGDTVFFKGGVQYVLTGDGKPFDLIGIGLDWSGTPGQPITYDGNSAGTWGVGNAILLGSDTNFVIGFVPDKGASNIAFTHSIFVGPVGEAEANGNSYVCQFDALVSNGSAATDTYIEQTNSDGSAIMYNGNPWFMGASNGFSLAYEMVTNSLGTNMYVIEDGSPPSPTNTVLFYTQSDYTQSD